MALDWDTLLSYSTIKIVKIYDRRLGIIHYIFQLLILVYIVVYSLVLQQRYLRSEQPYGSVRSTLREPNATALPDSTELPYCLQNQRRQVNSEGNFSNYNCIFGLGNDVTFPPAPTNSIYATTRIKDTTLKVPDNCTVTTPLKPLSKACIPVTASTSQSYYVANIEDFTVFLEHAVYGQINNIAVTNNGLKGELYYQGREQPDELSGPRAGDILTLRTVLEAAGIKSLDAPSGVAGGNTYRYDGIELVVIITYSNRASEPSLLKYRYDISVIPGVDSAAFDPSQIVDSTTMVTSARHGIKLIYIIAGSIGVFDFQTLLVNIVSSVVLLKAATTVVDILMEYVMPDKDKYKSHKYEESEDFSDERAMNRM